MPKRLALCSLGIAPHQNFKQNCPNNVSLLVACDWWQMSFHARRSSSLLLGAWRLFTSPWRNDCSLQQPGRDCSLPTQVGCDILLSGSRRSAHRRGHEGKAFWVAFPSNNHWFELKLVVKACDQAGAAPVFAAWRFALVPLVLLRLQECPAYAHSNR